MKKTKPILKIENLSKQYRLGVVGTGTISHDLNRWWHKVRGKEDPFLKIGEANVQATKSDSKYVWALKDINFEVMPGEVLGIIGKNGAGKSTLLKILSRVTGPTTGSIKSRGRIASLLEVGTGFHPELTGKENIYLNGAILGMTKKEIKSKIEEIVDFAGVARYIDTPVKRYSSGMRVRLAFAVAAHLEPDILVVDEVLAVGDAEFQKKAIGKMQDISRGEGRTVLFVSHNMAAVRNLCTRGIVLENGVINSEGSIDKVIQDYNTLTMSKNLTEFSNVYEIDKALQVQFTKIELNNYTRNLNVEKIFDVFDDLRIKLSFSIKKKIHYSTPCVWLKRDDIELFCSFLTDNNEELLDKGFDVGNYEYEIKLPKLKKGIYTITLVFGKIKVKDYHRWENCLSFEVDDISFDPGIKSYSGLRKGLIVSNSKWIKK